MGACGTDLCIVHSLRCFQLSQRAGLGVCILNERLYYQPLPPPPELLWLGGPRAMRADPDELKAAVFLLHLLSLPRGTRPGHPVTQTVGFCCPGTLQPLDLNITSPSLGSEAWHREVGTKVSQVYQQPSRHQLPETRLFLC